MELGYRGHVDDPLSKYTIYILVQLVKYKTTGGYGKRCFHLFSYNLITHWLVGFIDQVIAAEL